MADITAESWNEADAGNDQAAPDGAPEGMAPSGVNDTLRAVMGAVKRWFRWTTPNVTAGSATAFTLSYGVAPAVLADGMTHLVQFHVANGSGATLNVGGLGAKPLHAYAGGTWAAVPSGTVGANMVCKVAYAASAGAWRIVSWPGMPGAAGAAGGDLGGSYPNPTVPAKVPTGSVIPFAGASVPAGWLLCGGQAVSRTTYAALFAAVGTTYGAGDGSTTFNVPDLRGRVAVGRDNMDSNASRVTFLATGIDGDALGAAGGAQAVTLSIAEMPSHTHGIGPAALNDESGTSAGSQTGNTGNLYETPGTGAAGGGGPHLNMQPSIILNQIIKT